jgi:hypothetical protein
VVSEPIEYATVPSRPTTERSAQICAGIVTNLALEVLHPQAELHNPIAAFTRIIVRRRWDFENAACMSRSPCPARVARAL